MRGTVRVLDSDGREGELHEVPGRVRRRMRASLGGRERRTNSRSGVTEDLARRTGFSPAELRAMRNESAEVYAALEAAYAADREWKDGPTGEPADARRKRERLRARANAVQVVRHLNRQGRVQNQEPGEDRQLTDEQVSTLRAAIALADEIQDVAPSISGRLRAIEPALDQHVQGVEEPEGRENRGRRSNYVARQPSTPRVSEAIRRKRGLEGDPVRVIPTRG